MIHRFVKLEFSRREMDEIRSIFEDIAHAVRSSEGCLYLDIMYDISNRGKVITYSHWASEEHLNAYRDSDVFKDFWAMVKPRFTRPAEAWSMQVAIHMP